MSPRVEIEYCTQCRWLLRAAWMAQELLTTFAEEIGEVALVPGRGGVFDVRVEGALVFSRQEQRRFPDAKELKRLKQRAGILVADVSGHRMTDAMIGAIGRTRSSCLALKLDRPIQRTFPSSFSFASVAHPSSISCSGSGQWIW